MNDEGSFIDDEGSGKSKHKKTVENKDPKNIDFESELRGRTLKAYLFLMKSAKPVGVRELQRALDLSSPSVAYHHLEKLERLKLVEKDQYGEYNIVKNVDINVLQSFAHIGKLLVPRFLFYAVFFSTLLGGYLTIYQGNANLFGVSFGGFAAAFAWYETLRTWKKRPF
ncbi:MAG: winged helix-turn-helix domain-containing protein [Nitrososphaerales archaeon]